MAGRQCLKRLYLGVHQPELAEPSESLLHRAQTGQEVLEIARELFPHGLLIRSGSEPEVALEKTRGLINEGTACPLFEAAFEYEDVLIRTDVLILKPEARLIEVKSATRCKQHHVCLSY